MPVIGNGPLSLEDAMKGKYHHRNNIVGKSWYKFIQQPLAAKDYIESVSNAFRIGFDLIDYSSGYGSGILIGKAIRKSGVTRDKLFLSTKVNPVWQVKNKVRECVEMQLKNFGVDYFDLVLLHWPVTECYLDNWKELEKLYKEGICRAIGVANCHQHHLESISGISDIVPAVNQIEVHPLLTQKSLIGYCQEKGIVVESYTPIARNDDRLIRIPALKRIAQKYHKSVIQVILRWQIQNGCVPIVRALNKKHQSSNLDIFDFSLTQEELKTIDEFNINSRLRFDPDNVDFKIFY